MPTPPLHERLYRAILRLFPREFRGDFGDEMAADFSDQREEAARRGAATAIPRLWARTVIDALHRAPREHLDILRRDATYALRLFRRRPGTTISALLTLAIGIGLTTAVFSVVYSVLWRNLPLHEADRLVYLAEVGPAPQRAGVTVSPDNFVDWQRETRTMKGLTSVRPRSATIIQPAGAEEFLGAGVTRRFFEVLPARPLLGRLFNDADFEPLLAQIAAQDPKKPSRGLFPTVTVIGYDLWQRQFGGRSDVIGQRVNLGRLGPVEIVGVLDKDFQLPVFANAAALFPDVPELDNRRARYLMVLGRLERGVTVEAAQSEFDVIADRLARAYPEANKDRGVRITSMREHLTASASIQLWFLFATAICVLLIACANVSNLLLAYTSGRQRELQTRVALGASRAHLVRQALTEGLVLAVAGASAGMLLAWWAVPSLVAVAPRNIPRLSEVRVGWEAGVFAGSLAVCVGITCGLAAAVMAGRSGIASLRTAGPGNSSGRRFRQGLIVVEIALALMLAVAAGLLVQTLRVVTSLPLGFDPASVLAIGFSPDLSMEGTKAKASFEAELLAAVRSVPGVVAAGVGSRPLNPGGMGTAITLPADPATSIRIAADAVGPGYLEALGARLIAGRFFNESDDPQAPRVALVNETAAKQHWQGNPIGQTFVMNKRTVQVVGVLGDVRRSGLEVDPEPTLYLASVQTSNLWTNNMLVRTAGDPRELLPRIQTVMRNANPRLPLRGIETLQERLDITTAPRRFTLWLVSLFSVIAVVLAVIGIYGVVMESVAQRVPEIGIRIALGASAATVMQMILRQGGWMIGLGVALGSCVALAINGVMSAFVFRVPTTDPLSFVVACLALVSTGLAACAIPARRASRIDPVMALRQDV